MLQIHRPHKNSRAHIPHFILELFHNGTFADTVHAGNLASSRFQTMPSPFAPTFASAAASTNGENSGNRRDNTATSEWYGRYTQDLNLAHETTLKYPGGVKPLHLREYFFCCLALLELNFVDVLCPFTGLEVESTVPPRPSAGPPERRRLRRYRHKTARAQVRTRLQPTTLACTSLPISAPLIPICLATLLLATPATPRTSS